MNGIWPSVYQTHRSTCIMFLVLVLLYHIQQSNVSIANIAPASNSQKNAFLNIVIFIQPLHVRICTYYTVVTFYTVSTAQNIFRNLLNTASFAQLQFKSLNICLFSIKFPILVKVSITIIEVLAFNKWSSKVYRF